MAWLLRMLGYLVLFRFLNRRSGGGGRWGKLSIAKPPLAVAPWMRDVLDDVGVGSHLAIAAGLGVLAVLGIVITATLLVLGPRVLGTVVAIITLVLAILAWFEARRFWKSLRMRNWRHHPVVIFSDDDNSQAQ